MLATTPDPQTGTRAPAVHMHMVGLAIHLDCLRHRRCAQGQPQPLQQVSVAVMAQDRVETHTLQAADVVRAVRHIGLLHPPVGRVLSLRPVVVGALILHLVHQRSHAGTATLDDLSRALVTQRTEATPEGPVSAVPRCVLVPLGTADGNKPLNAGGAAEALVLPDVEAELVRLARVFVTGGLEDAEDERLGVRTDLPVRRMVPVHVPQVDDMSVIAGGIGVRRPGT